METISLNVDHDIQVYKDEKGYEYSIAYCEDIVNVHADVYDGVLDWYRYHEHMEDKLTVKDLRNYLNGCLKYEPISKFQIKEHEHTRKLLKKIVHWESNKTIEL